MPTQSAGLKTPTKPTRVSDSSTQDGSSAGTQVHIGPRRTQVAGLADHVVVVPLHLQDLDAVVAADGPLFAPESGPQGTGARPERPRPAHGDQQTRTPRLESDAEPNVPLHTLPRIAAALAKELRIS